MAIIEDFIDEWLILDDKPISEQIPWLSISKINWVRSVDINLLSILSRLSSLETITTNHEWRIDALEWV